MPEENLPPSSSRPPQIPGPHQFEAYDDTKLLSRIDTLERSYKHLTKIVEFVQNTNSVILLVMALGFIALLVSVIGMVIQGSREQSAVQLQLIQTVNSLRNEINNEHSTKEPFLIMPDNPSQATNSALPESTSPVITQ